MQNWHNQRFNIFIDVIYLYTNWEWSSFKLLFILQFDMFEHKLFIIAKLAQDEYEGKVGFNMKVSTCQGNHAMLASYIRN